MDKCECLKGGEWVKIDMCGSPHTYINFLWFISFVSVDANFETFIKPHTAIACDSIEEISLKQSTHTETQKSIKMKIIRNMWLSN